MQTQRPDLTPQIYHAVCRAEQLFARASRLLKDGGEGRRTNSKSPWLTPGVDVKHEQEHGHEHSKLDNVVKAEPSQEDSRAPTPLPSVNGKRKAEDDQGEAKRIKVEEEENVQDPPNDSEHQLEESRMETDMVMGNAVANVTGQIEAEQAAEVGTETIAAVGTVNGGDEAGEEDEEDEEDEEVEEVEDRERQIGEKKVEAEAVAEAVPVDAPHNVNEIQPVEVLSPIIPKTEPSVANENPDEINIGEDEPTTSST